MRNIVDALVSRFHPEIGSSNRYAVMVVGLNFEQEFQLHGDTPYQRNVRFIHNVLSRRGYHISVLAGIYNYTYRERLLLGQMARITGNTGRDEVSLTDQITSTGEVFSLKINRFIRVPDRTAAYYPKDWLVIGEHLVATDPVITDIASLNTPTNAHIRRKGISEGGRYVVNREVVFAGFEGPDNEQNRADIRTLLHPNKYIIFIPTPKQLGIVDKTRVTVHIDQFIGKALPSRDGTTLFVPIDASYYNALQNSPYSLANFDTRVGDRIIRFVKIDPNIFQQWHLLNNVGTDHITFIGPMLQAQLNQRGIWRNIDQGQVVVLPKEITATDSPEGGLACKLVLTSAAREIQMALLSGHGRRG